MEKPRLEAELLLADTLGCKRLDLYLRHEQPLFESELAPLRAKVRRRANREPLQYIIGTVEFGDLCLKIDARALIPRPETEEWLHWLIEKFAYAQPARILELGTGSGAIALTLAKTFPQAHIVATDISQHALTLAKENATQTNLDNTIDWRCGSWWQPIAANESFDWIIANPPYLSDDEVAQAQPEVRLFEPAQALASPENGLADLRHILQSAPKHLTPQGLLVLETGIDQHHQLHHIAQQVGFTHSFSKKDLSARDRCFLASFGLPLPQQPTV
ncbi:MAG: peptide chain release factor N(5)-glutamine methyltransferase [Verrucomicrobia bacterium]|nr:peptide chain release factor N(5)-glutamine methyltransferase [Verrucomicrobiota bacterium]